MKLDDSLLIAYADGELSAADAASVEQALAESVDLRRTVELLRASRLPYREAFARQKLPPVPDELRRRVEAMASAAQERTGFAARQPARRSPSLLWLAAAFVAGAFCVGLVQQLNARLPGAFSNGAATTASVDRRSWVSVAADYQRMYTRETVESVAPDRTAAVDKIDAIRNVDGIRLRVPDLRPAGLAFKSVERLRYDGKPLVQIVYLPERGVPVALCVIKDSRPDESIAQKKVDGMTVVSWRQNELAYALIGTPDSGDLPTIARQIANANVDEIFSALAADRPARG
ncbi:zf-HC2 domain-containing protein [Paraburkholderia strydomiana]|uniref:anti-sigma factor family protein n=1 Tax=Paraburkholderia strydomiana TaxID=1245417 RepID=UPI0038BD9793